MPVTSSAARWLASKVTYLSMASVKSERRIVAPPLRRKDDNVDADSNYKTKSKIRTTAFIGRYCFVWVESLADSGGSYLRRHRQQSQRQQQ